MSRGKSRGAVLASMAMSTPAQRKSKNRTPSAMASAMPCTSVTPEMRTGLPKSKSGQKPISDNVRRLLAGDSAFDDDFEDEGRKFSKRLKTDNQIGGMLGRVSQKRPGAFQQSTLTSMFQRQPGFLKHLGIANLGNTCYMNAVTQAILGLPAFADDLTKPEVAALSLPEDGVITALRKCIEARKQTLNNGKGAPLSLEDLKRAMERFAGFGHGAMQQDAHEFTLLLLQTLQNEILAAEWKRAEEGRPVEVEGEAEGDGEQEPPSVKLSETCCPVARSFEFSLLHSFVCGGCGHRSQMLERFNHLSLELPSHTESPKTSDLAALLGAYMEGGSVEKGCEGCGATSASHRLSSAFARAPKVLVLHLKRFQVVLGQDGALPQLGKLKARVRAPESLALGPWCLQGTLPPAHRCCPKQHSCYSPGVPKGPWWAEDCNKENRPTSSTVTGTREATRSTPNTRASVPFARTASQQRKQQQQYRKSHDIKALLQQGGNKGAALTLQPLGPALEARELDEEQLQRTLEASHNEGASSEEALLQQALLASLQDAGGNVQKQAEVVPSASPNVEVINLDSDEDEDEDVRKALALSLKDAANLPIPRGSEASYATDSTAEASPTANTCWVQVLDEEVANSFTETGRDARQGGGATGPESAVPRPIYSLRSVIRHIGHQATEGHFIADVRGRSGWMQYDDSHVSTLNDPTGIAASTEREQECYLLFYDLTK